MYIRMYVYMYVCINVKNAFVRTTKSTLLVQNTLSKSAQNHLCTPNNELRIITDCSQTQHSYTFQRQTPIHRVTSTSNT